MAFEGVEPTAPRGAVGRQPLVDFPQRLGPQPVHAALGVDPDVDEPRVPEHPQVLGDRGLADVQRRHELTDWSLVLPEEIEDAAAVGLGQDLEHAS